jgi:signal transduction histidine kinase
MSTFQAPPSRDTGQAAVAATGGRRPDSWGVLQTGALLRRATWNQRGLLLLAIAAPLLLAFLFAFHERSALISEAQESARRSAVALEQHAANVLDVHALILRQLDVLTNGRTSDQIRTDELLRITLSGFSRELTQVSTIGITDAAGNVITNSYRPSLDGLSVADRDYFLAHSRGSPAGIFVSEAFTGRATKQRQFALSIRRTLPGGEFGGVIFTTVPLEHFTAFWRGFTPSGGHLIPMVRPDGALIVTYPQIDSPQHLDPRGPFISHLTRARQGLYTAVSLVDGIERINAYSQVKNYPLFISFSVETSTVLQAWRNLVVGVSLLALVIAGLLVAIWVAAMRESQEQRLSAAKWERVARALQDEVARRHQAEESLRRGTERISFGDQLIGIVSHDLRNPLNTISLSASVIARRNTLEPRDAQLLQRIQIASQRATGLIHDLLDFTQARLVGRIPVHVRPMNFHELLHTVLAEVQANYPGRSIECALDAADARGEWDPDRLAQVIENLLANALKYGVQAGTIRVRTSSDATSFKLEVHNEGAPIADEKMALIFEPLQRGVDTSQPNPDRSIGIGLFIVRHIVDAHGGSLSVTSTLQEGTTFIVQLPRSS